MDASGSTLGTTAVRTCHASPAEEEALALARRSEPSSLGAMFLNRVAATPTLESYRRPAGNGEWASENWRQTGEAVVELAAGLLRLGLQPEERVAVASATRVEWIHADLAILCSGGATTTVYPTSTPADVEHVVSDSGSRFAFAENAAQLAKVRAHGLSLEKIVLIDGDDPDPAVLTWDGLKALGRELLAEDPDAVVAAT